jgi:BTB/POZ domain
MHDYIEFDPDGDIILILPEGCYELCERKFKRMVKLLAEVEDEEPDERVREEVDRELGRDLPKETNGNDSIIACEAGCQAESRSDGDSDSEPGEVRMRVSSKHLALVSPVFKSLFKGSFLEGQSLSSAGTAEVSLPDDDPYGLEILLNIIHGRLKEVPTDLSTIELTQVAVLIDKYELHEISLMYSCAWIDSLKKSLPTRYTEDLLTWICIFRILSKPEYFAQMTKIALRESEGPLCNNNAETTLPIPESLLGKDFVTFHNASCSPSFRNYRVDTGGDAV